MTQVKANRVQQLTYFFLGGFALLLPLYEQGNTWFLIGLVLLCAYQAWTQKLGKFLKTNKLLIIIPALLLLIRIIGITYASDIATGIKETTRALSFLFLPFSFLVLSKILPKKTIKTVFSFLTIGCLLAAIICWTSVLKIIIENNEPFTNLFTWKKSNVYLTKVIDIHPPYLGALVLTALIYVFKTYLHRQTFTKTKIWAGGVVVIFALFLFHLVVRNSLLFLILLGFGYTLYFKQWKTFLLGVLLLGGLAFTIIENGNHYLKRKYYKMLDLSDEKIGDKRFDRLEASWNVFTQQPLVGVGMGTVADLRLKEYKKMKYEHAIEHNFNSHNQYMEYLCTFGIIGLFIFIGVLFFLLKKSLINQEYFLAILLCLLMFACLTESFLERELGIKYLSLIAGLIAFRTALPTKQKL